MSPLRKLAGQTAIYGVSQILGRLINFLLAPLYTRIFLPDEYGVISELYAYVAFLLVILTYGMETALFRFVEKKARNNRIYSTILYSVGSTTVLFLVLVLSSATGIADLMGYEANVDYIRLFAFIIAFDVIAAIPMARLRQLDRPYRFLVVNLGSILLNVGLNLFFLIYCPQHWKEHGANSNWLVKTLYTPGWGLIYVFIANVVSSGFKILMVLPWILVKPFTIDREVLRRVLPYALPLMILGLAGIVNQTFDRVMLKHLLPLPEKEALAELGIYNACYKVAMLLSIGIQAFRYAAEPFIFSHYGRSDSKKIYAEIMRYYFIAAWVIFLGLTLFQDVALLLIGSEFRAGKDAIPVLLLAYIFFGAVFNLSFWYKLTDKTRFGALISIVGAVITISLNFLLVPKIGYMGAAWATFAAYAVMLIISYILSKSHYPIPYDLRSIGAYSLLALAFWLVWTLFGEDATGFLRYGIAALLFLAYLVVIWRMEVGKNRIKTGK